MNVKTSFGKIVKEARLARQWSQEILATRSKLQRTYITGIECGGRNLSLENIAKIANGLGMSIAQFFPNDVTDKAHSLRPMNGSDPLDILLVEDNSLDVDLTLAAFQEAKLANHVHVVRDGAAALEYIFGGNRAKPNRPLPVAVLLDLNLPKVAGLEVLRSIMADPVTRHIKVVVLTASKSEEDAREALQLGAAGYIAKPVDFHNFSQITAKLGFCWTLLKPGVARGPIESPRAKINRAAPALPPASTGRADFQLPSLNSPTTPPQP